jgi:hypothetical protein
VKIFRCDHCGHPVFFENVQCLHCGSALAFLPDHMFLAAVEAPADAPELLERKSDKSDGTRYRMCNNHTLYQACNFAVLQADPNPLCVSCRQTRLLPDLSVPDNQARWYRVEVAKRRLYYTLAKLGLIGISTSAQPDGDVPAKSGPVFEFLADLPGGPPVMTGHRNGLITLNIAEADDDERTHRRVALHEPYRTLLGHLRHESGHYYWDVLIRDQGRTEEFSAVFGDASADYTQALQRHYAQAGMHPDWQNDYVSMYATSHPWEDWAETWAHYLHMVDLLETAAAYRTSVAVPGSENPRPARITNPFEKAEADFDTLVAQWVPVTLMVNSLNRSLGQNDAYPFALSEGALRKLRFVHEVIQAQSQPRVQLPTQPQTEAPAADATPETPVAAPTTSAA